VYFFMGIELAEIAPLIGPVTLHSEFQFLGDSVAVDCLGTS
jgi:hypothetical protein